MSTCGVCVQPFDFMSSESARGHDLCVLQEERDKYIQAVDDAENATLEATESYDSLEEEVSGLEEALNNALAALEIQKEDEEETVKEETELC